MAKIERKSLRVGGSGFKVSGVWEEQGKKEAEGGGGGCRLSTPLPSVLE